MNPHRKPVKQRASTKYRALLKTGRPLVLAAAPSAWHAGLLEQAGIDLIYGGGNNVMRPLLGVAAEVVTPDEFTWMNHFLARATAQPVVADIDTGFGGNRRTSRVIEQLITSGVASIRIEDKAAIRRPHWAGGGSPMAPLDEAISRIRAIAEIRDELDPDFVIQAFCKVLDDSDDFDEAVRRLEAYREAGADVLHLNVSSIEQVREARRRLKGPLVCTGHNAAEVPGLETVEAHAREGLAVVWWANLLVWKLNITAVDWLNQIRQEGYGPWVKYRDENKTHPAAFVFVQQKEVDERMEKFERAIWPAAHQGPDADGWEYKGGSLDMPGWEWTGGDPTHKTNWRCKK